MKTSKPSKHFFLRIVLLPVANLSSIAVKIATKYAKLGDTYYVIDGKNFLAHITVYYGKFAVADKQKVLKVVQDISIKHPSFSLEYDKVEYLEGWAMLNFKLKGEVRKIHKEMLKELETLGEVHPYLTKENYHPHLSLLRYKNDKLDLTPFSKKIKINKNMFQHEWKYLGIANREEHGTVSKLIKKYKLK